MIPVEGRLLLELHFEGIGGGWASRLERITPALSQIFAASMLVIANTRCCISLALPSGSLLVEDESVVLGRIVWDQRRIIETRRCLLVHRDGVDRSQLVDLFKIMQASIVRAHLQVHVEGVSEGIHISSFTARRILRILEAYKLDTLLVYFLDRLKSIDNVLRLGGLLELI